MDLWAKLLEKSLNALKLDILCICKYVYVYIYIHMARGGSRAAKTFKMERFVITVNGWKH